ncbi:dihydropteroate synthase [Pseudomonas fluvialis]|uniref:dihydropteroate synthase n=1 Tax=Pseudomonas fluvialis TaxID=1793966 RepID=UPI00370BB652
MAVQPFRLPCGSRTLDLSRPQVMGILNVTPDSFSDGGRYNRIDAALRHAEQMLEAGAAIIDVGGESTRPGAPPVSAEEELQRVAPVVEQLVCRLDALVSVDTSSPALMREAALLGAGMINDVRSLSRDGALQAAAQGNLAVCLMHMQGEPQTMQDSPQYDDVTTAVRTFLADRVAACEAVGIARERLLIDPGFGFAKTLAHNLSLFRHMQALHDLHLPLLVGVSRKSMIGKVLGREVDQRLAGSLALAALAVQQGAHILRVHDVAETVDVLRMLEAVAEAD